MLIDICSFRKNGGRLHWRRLMAPWRRAQSGCCKRTVINMRGCGIIAEDLAPATTAWGGGSPLTATRGVSGGHGMTTPIGAPSHVPRLLSCARRR